MVKEQYIWIVKAKACTLAEMKHRLAGRTRKQAIDAFRKHNGWRDWDSKNYEVNKYSLKLVG